MSSPRIEIGADVLSGAAVKAAREKLNRTQEQFAKEAKITVKELDDHENDRYRNTNIRVAAKIVTTIDRLNEEARQAESPKKTGRSDGLGGGGRR